MRLTIGATIIAIVSALAAAMPSAAAYAAGTAGLSPAQIALFETDHLQMIHRPSVLEYTFRFDDGGPESYADKIGLTITAIRPDGRKDIAVDFLTGRRRIPFPPATDFKGNPLLMFFLQYDVIEMHRLTGGSTLFFRNRIRDAFLEAADMHPVRLTFEGRQVDGTEIVIRPYATLTRPEIAKYVGKAYRFVLSDAVPGTVYRIETDVPKSDDAPARTESATFVGERHD